MAVFKKIIRKFVPEYDFNLELKQSNYAESKVSIFKN